MLDVELVVLLLVLVLVDVGLVVLALVLVVLDVEVDVQIKSLDQKQPSTPIERRRILRTSPRRHLISDTQSALFSIACIIHPDQSCRPQ